MMSVFQVLIALLLFFGYVQMALVYDEYVSLLSLIGCLAAGHLFSCLVVFQFRKNLMEERAILNAVQQVEDGELFSYSEDGCSLHYLDESSPGKELLNK